MRAAIILLSALLNFCEAGWKLRGFDKGYKWTVKSKKCPTAAKSAGWGQSYCNDHFKKINQEVLSTAITDGAYISREQKSCILQHTAAANWRSLETTAYSFGLDYLEHHSYRKWMPHKHKKQRMRFRVKHSCGECLQCNHTMIWDETVEKGAPPNEEVVCLRVPCLDVVIIGSVDTNAPAPVGNEWQKFKPISCLKKKSPVRWVAGCLNGIQRAITWDKVEAEFSKELDAKKGRKCAQVNHRRDYLSSIGQLTKQRNRKTKEFKSKIMVSIRNPCSYCVICTVRVAGKVREKPTIKTRCTRAKCMGKNWSYIDYRDRAVSQKASR